MRSDKNRSVHRQSPLTKINLESSTYCTRGCYFELVRTLNYTLQVKIQTRKPGFTGSPNPGFRVQ